MTNLLWVELVSLEGQIFSGEAQYMVAPSIEGEVGIYPRHISFISKLNPGVLRLKMPHSDEYAIYAISGGYLEVHANCATILADIVERSGELDKSRLIEQKNSAENVINNARSSGDLAKAYSSLEMAIAHLKALEYTKNKMKSE